MLTQIDRKQDRYLTINSTSLINKEIILAFDLSLTHKSHSNVCLNCYMILKLYDRGSEEYV